MELCRTTARLHQKKRHGTHAPKNNKANNKMKTMAKNRAAQIRRLCGLTAGMNMEAAGGKMKKMREARGGRLMMCAQRTAEAEATEADKEEMEALRGVVRPPSAQSVAAAAANAAAASVGNVAVDGEESVAMVAAACRAMAAGDVVRVRVVQERRSGYLVRFKAGTSADAGVVVSEGEKEADTKSSDATPSIVVLAFLPTSQLLRPRASGAQQGGVPPSRKVVVGEQVDVLVTVAEMTLGKPRIIVSERAAKGLATLGKLEQGQVFAGIVTGLADFGAFVALKDADGNFNGIEGLLHLNEISWDKVKHPSDRLNLGQAVDVMVKEISTEAKKVYLSLKSLEPDPLTETIDSVLGGEEGGSDDADAIDGFGDICGLLLADNESIRAVTPTRSFTERHIVSQQMEVYLATENVDDGYKIVIRKGRRIQEALVATTLSREAMKEALIRASAQLATVGANE